MTDRRTWLTPQQQIGAEPNTQRTIYCNSCIRATYTYPGDKVEPLKPEDLIRFHVGISYITVCRPCANDLRDAIHDALAKGGDDD